MTTKHTGNTKTTREDLAAGGTVIVHLDAVSATIAVAPAAGGTALVEFTISAGEHIESGDALWAPALGLGPAGVVSGLTLDTIPSTITAVRVTASAAGARVEIAQ